MKKNMFLLAIGFVTCTAFWAPLVLPTDYRDAYVGNYICKSNCQTLNADQKGISVNTDTITINVSKNNLDSILNVKAGKGTWQVKLKSNIMYSYPEGNRWGGVFVAKDSISFAVSAHHTPNSCNYQGKKK